MNRLKIAREAKKLSQNDVAKILKTTQPSVSSHESGTRDVDTDLLKKYAKIYECSIDYLLGVTNDPTPSTPMVKIKPESQKPGGQQEFLLDDEYLQEKSSTSPGRTKRKLDDELTPEQQALLDATEKAMMEMFRMQNKEKKDKK